MKSCCPFCKRDANQIKTRSTRGFLSWRIWFQSALNGFSLRKTFKETFRLHHFFNYPSEARKVSRQQSYSDGKFIVNSPSVSNFMYFMIFSTFTWLFVMSCLRNWGFNNTTNYYLTGSEIKHKENFANFYNLNMKLMMYRESLTMKASGNKKLGKSFSKVSNTL